ncbi:MAG: hypothetical protein M1827_007232 [Pycnora praestabilis]|nr:MAG: hypothetical protein M1827_007232 [Pycnora praestabilis]
MESSSLMLAHAHARNALQQTQKSNVTAASEEHDEAAGEFANAAKVTGDAEVGYLPSILKQTLRGGLQALRTLHLLEQHHQKLSQIIKFRSSHPTSIGSTGIPSTTEVSVAASPVHAKPTASPQVPRTSSPLRTPQTPPLPISHRAPPRDLSSSIASNLASARGIPGSQPQRRGAPVSPTLSAQHAGGKILGQPARIRLADQKRRRQDESVSSANQRALDVRSSSPPPLATSGEPTKNELGISDDKTRNTTNNLSDEPFQRFYSTFENLFSRLSAPLAFAGLPLSAEDATAAASKVLSTGEKSIISSGRVTAEPDVTKIFSKAALRAVREEYGLGGGGFGGAESFYVVPITGGTISYAGILSRAEQEGMQQRSIEGGGDHGDEEFVDARETPQPISPGLRKLGVRSTRIGTKTMEELELENQALKFLSDNLSRRLHMWETNAQSSSLALAQSLRSLQPVSPTQSEAGGGGDERLKDLEEQLRSSKREMEKMGKENEKLRGVVGRYRERWEKLKEGARVRRGEGTDKGDEGGS